METINSKRKQCKIFSHYIVVCVCFLLIVNIRVNGQQSGGRTYTGDNKIKTNPIPPKTEPKPKTTPKPVTTPKPIQEKQPEKPKAPENLKIPELIPITPGIFTMGSTAPRSEEQPLHSVELEAFEIGKYEITNKEFEVFISSTNYLTQPEREKSPITWRSYFTLDRENYPVVLVSWHDAAAYCKWLSEVTNKSFRLPTEAEWEYAARGGVTTKYPWGDEIDVEQANYDSELNRGLIAGVVLENLEPVDSYNANGYGLFNVSGNVAEWCQDWYEQDYYKKSSLKNPLGPETGLFKVIRGGGWASQSDACRLSRRNNNSTTFAAAYLGFRIVKVNQ
ncbi:MAG: SUMF1/EgtB/PvdO family nonheme iron enzyme [Acidobacteria bacterium]|nr:SUMF1/EgtB/PvdO family nonheme iron enzyme [Acidobacteriota bacterium]